MKEKNRHDSQKTVNGRIYNKKIVGGKDRNA